MADATSATITPLHQPQAKKAKTQAGRPEAIRRLVELGLKAKR
jgi:hypothetical protein